MTKREGRELGDLRQARETGRALKAEERDKRKKECGAPGGGTAFGTESRKSNKNIEIMRKKRPITHPQNDHKLTKEASGGRRKKVPSAKA